MKYLFLLLLSFNALASSDRYAGLSESEQAVIDVAISQMKLDKLKQNKQSITESLTDTVSGLNLSEESINEMGQIGTQLGKVVTGFVTEIGLTVVEFLNTPWGIIAIILLAWHLFASDISLIMMSFGVMYIFFKFWALVVGPALYEYIEHDKKYINKNALEDTPGIIAVIAFIVLLIIQIFITGNIGK